MNRFTLLSPYTIYNGAKGGNNFFFCLKNVGFFNLYVFFPFQMFIKYSTLVHGRKMIKQIVTAMEMSWNLDITDDEMAFLLRYIRAMESVYKYTLISGISMFAVKPFFVKGSSIFDCYVFPQIPFPLFYTVELYLLLFGASSFIFFNIFICHAIIKVVIQFKFLNFKIKELNFGDHPTKLTKDLKSLIKYQQFLIRLV